MDFFIVIELFLRYYKKYQRRRKTNKTKKKVNKKNTKKVPPTLELKATPTPQIPFPASAATSPAHFVP